MNVIFCTNSFAFRYSVNENNINRHFPLISLALINAPVLSTKSAPLVIIPRPLLVVRALSLIFEMQKSFQRAFPACFFFFFFFVYHLERQSGRIISSATKTNKAPAKQLGQPIRGKAGR